MQSCAFAVSIEHKQIMFFWNVCAACGIILFSHFLGVSDHIENIATLTDRLENRAYKTRGTFIVIHTHSVIHTKISQKIFKNNKKRYIFGIQKRLNKTIHIYNIKPTFLEYYYPYKS